MRALTPEELDLIVGADNNTATLTPVTVTGHAPPPSPSPPPGGGDGSPPQPPPPPPCPQPLPETPRDNQNYVYNNEGVALSTTGYTLDPVKHPNSGVTIGYGVDLAKHSISELSTWGVSGNGIATLTPFLGPAGPTGQSAVNAVNTNGAPSITSQDAINMSNGAYEQIVSAAAARFDSGSSVTFDSLPANAQTVIADIAYNSGANGAPNFFADVIAGNWAAAVNELNNWYGPGSTDPRHQRDANLLQQSINNGELAADGTCTR